MHTYNFHYHKIPSDPCYALSRTKPSVQNKSTLVGLHLLQVVHVTMQSGLSPPASVIHLTLCLRQIILYNSMAMQG